MVVLGSFWLGVWSHASVCDAVLSRGRSFGCLQLMAILRDGISTSFRPAKYWAGNRQFLEGSKRVGGSCGCVWDRGVGGVFGAFGLVSCPKIGSTVLVPALAN